MMMLVLVLVVMATARSRKLQYGSLNALQMKKMLLKKMMKRSFDSNFNILVYGQGVQSVHYGERVKDILFDY
jgi:hypothetical protein